MATVEKRGPYQYRAKVRKKGFATKTKTFTTRKTAEEWARKTESEMERGIFVCTREAENTTMGEALERYADEISPEKRGAGQERLRIASWRRHPLAQQSLASVRGADLAKYRDGRLAAGKSSNTVRLELAIISHLFSIARKEWGMESLANPVQAIRLPRASKARDRRLRGDEEQRLLKACRKSRSTQLEKIVVAAIETGMRVGELLALEWENVDLRNRVAHLPETKNGSSRDVPLSTRAVDVLRSLPRNIKEGRVFFEWKRADSIGNLWRRALRRADIEGLRFHDLRHEATSRFFEKGLNIMEVAAITGHKNLGMLKRYTHLKAQDLAAKLG